MIKELDYQTKAVDELVEKCAKLLQSGGERKKLTALLDGVAKMKLHLRRDLGSDGERRKSVGHNGVATTNKRLGGL